MAKRILKPKPKKIFQLHIELDGVVPPIWRRVLVPESITLAELHNLLNEVMGWSDSHLHQFRLRDRLFGDLSHDPDDELGFEDEREVELSELVGAGNTIDYEYDFGDGWLHRVKVEKLLPFDPRLRYPLCVGGARACPPDDCGGVGGYGNFLEAIRNPKHSEHDNSLTWVGGFFDPEGFDANRVNWALAHSEG